MKPHSLSPFLLLKFNILRQAYVSLFGAPASHPFTYIRDHTGSSEASNRGKLEIRGSMMNVDSIYVPPGCQLIRSIY